MIIELKDTPDTVFHDQFQKWRETNRHGIFLTLDTMQQANLHGSACQHLGSTDWVLDDNGLTVAHISNDLL